MAQMVENVVDFTVTIFGRSFKVKGTDYYRARHEAVQKYLKTYNKKDNYPAEFLMSVAQVEKVKKSKLGRPRNNQVEDV